MVSSDPRDAASWSESRLGTVGTLVLAAERQQIPAVPIGLINGDWSTGGGRPPFPAGRMIASLSALIDTPSIADDGLTELLGPPVFPGGCDVSGDIEGLLAGRGVELRLTPRMVVDPTATPTAIDLTCFPPDLDVDMVTANLARTCPVPTRSERPTSGSRRTTPPSSSASPQSSTPRRHGPVTGCA